MKILITSGPTREYIDPVRYISNASSGKMGCAAARAAVEAGHEVTFISGPTCQPIPARVEWIAVETTDEMFRNVSHSFETCDCLIMAAAVADYTPVAPSSSKLKKSGEGLFIECKPTRDILQWAGDNKTRQVLVGFALEDTDMRLRAEEKMAAKNLDVIVANRPRAIGSDCSSVWIKRRGFDWIEVARTRKSAIAKQLIEMVEEIAEC